MTSLLKDDSEIIIVPPEPLGKNDSPDDPEPEVVLIPPSGPVIHEFKRKVSTEKAGPERERERK